MPGRVLLLLIGAAFFAGCAKDEPQAEGTRPADPKLLEPFVAAQKPAGALSVSQVRATGQDGQAVTVSGKIPPDLGKPFSATTAQFTLSDTKAVEELDEPD
jgi:hypothetical protein